jgi:hypothetical protein
VGGALGALIFILPAPAGLAADLGGAGAGHDHATAIMPPAIHGIQSTELFAASCTGAGSCTGGGGFQAAGKPLQPMVVTQSHGRWFRGVTLRLPANAAAQSYSEVTGMSCHSVGNCVAVGDYEYGKSNSLQAFIATESHGAWARAFAPRLPANAASPASAQLQAVSCAPDGSCAAAGSYQDSSGASQTMMLAKPAAGAWRQAAEVASPPNAAANPNPLMTGIACTGAGSCVAVGNYSVSASHFAPMGAIESKGVWHRATEIAVPRGAIPSTFTAITSISCPAAGPCFGVGQYAISATQSRAMAVTESKGRFGSAVEITAVPQGSSPKPSTYLQGVSCGPAGACLAVGGGRNFSGQSVAMYMVRSGNHWRASFLLPPAGAATGTWQLSALWSVSCTGREHCTAVGDYRDRSGVRQAEAASTLPPPVTVANALEHHRAVP